MIRLLCKIFGRHKTIASYENNTFVIACSRCDRVFGQEYGSLEDPEFFKRVIEPTLPIGDD